jgi:hypothetical protein
MIDTYNLQDLEQLKAHEEKGWRNRQWALRQSGEPQDSFITGTNTELIYASTAVGIAKNTFTSETALNDEATMGPQVYLPAGFWLPTKAALGKGIRIVARGIVSSTATPTYTFTVRLAASEAATSGPIILGTAALTTASGISNVPWQLEGDVILEGVGTTSGTSTVRGIGHLDTIGYGVAAPTKSSYIAWGGAASPGTVATVVQKAASFITVNVACSASSSSNTITLQQLLVFGLN